MTVSTPIPFLISSTSPIGVRLPHERQEAVPVHSTVHTIRRLGTGGGRMDTIPIGGGLLLFSANRGHHRHHQFLDRVSRRDLEADDDLDSLLVPRERCATCRLLCTPSRVVYFAGLVLDCTA